MSRDEHETRVAARGSQLARLLCLLCFLCFPASVLATTVTGTIYDAAGQPLASGKIILRLSQEGVVSDPALLLIQPPVICTITNGAIDAGCTVRGNDTISPASTFYKVRVITSGGQELLPERNYTIEGATWDIGTATPLASATVAAEAYQIVQDEGSNLTQRQTLNFTGAGVSCSDDSSNARTNCSISGGGGGGSTHQIDGVNLTSQDPINFQDTAEIDFTNPAAGNIQAALLVASIADSKLASNYSGIGSCLASQWVNALNDNAAPTCAQPDFSDLAGSATDAQVDDTITLTNITQITNRAITDTTGDLPASRVDDGGVATTQALFSGGAGAAGFRAIAAGDLPAHDVACATNPCVEKAEAASSFVHTDQANTYSGGGLQDLSANKLALPAATTLPASCTANKEIFVDTDATPAGQQVYLCNSTGNGWNLIGDGGGAARATSLMWAQAALREPASPMG